MRLNDEVAALKYIDEDWGQLEFWADKAPVQWPCGLVDLLDATWSNEGKNIQMGALQIVVRLADLRLTNSSVKAPSGQRQKAFAIYGLQKDVYKALHGWCGGNYYSKLIRTRTRKIKREDGARIFEMYFTTVIKDASAMPQYTNIPSPSVSVDVKKELPN